MFLCPLNNALSAPQPAAVDIGGLNLFPSIEISETYDSNILFAETSKKSSLVTILAPLAQLGLQKGVNTYTLQAAMQAGFYTSSSDDNYVDAQLQGEVHHEFSRKNIVDLAAQYSKAHEARGTAFSQGGGDLLIEPDKFHTVSLDGSYTYGSKDAIGRLTLTAGGLSKKYDTRRAITEARDRNNINIGATFFYQIQPKTSLLFEIKHSEIDYRLSTTRLDSSENRFFVGSEWEISNITTGNVRVGLLQKNFDNTDNGNFSGLSWEVSTVWSPLNYTRFTLRTSGRTEETNGVGSYIDSKTGSINWNHDWSSQVNTDVDFLIQKNDYNPSPQEEGIISAGATISYDMRRWLMLSLKTVHSQRFSNQNGQDYNKNEISFSVQATL